MILRPVRPQSPFGPPISKLPVGLTRYLILPLTRFLGSTGLMICSITASSICLWAMPGLCWVESTTVSMESGLPFTYLMVTCDFAAGGIEAQGRIVIADAPDRLARDGVEIHARVGRDLACQHHQVVLHQRFR